MRHPEMPTVKDDGALGGQSDSKRATDEQVRARKAAETALPDACRTLLSLGIQAGFVSITFGRIMQKLKEASQ